MKVLCIVLIVTGMVVELVSGLTVIGFGADLICRILPLNRKEPFKWKPFVIAVALLIVSTVFINSSISYLKEQRSNELQEIQNAVANREITSVDSLFGLTINYLDDNGDEQTYRTEWYGTDDRDVVESYDDKWHIGVDAKNEIIIYEPKTAYDESIVVSK